jgi:hypothetical protein
MICIKDEHALSQKFLPFSPGRTSPLGTTAEFIVWHRADSAAPVFFDGLMAEDFITQRSELALKSREPVFNSGLCFLEGRAHHDQ